MLLYRAGKGQKDNSPQNAILVRDDKIYEGMDLYGLFNLLSPGQLSVRLTLKRKKN